MSSIKEELGSFSKRPKKTFGQNFLRDIDICQRIVGNVPLGTGSLVTEIGPGLGILTQCLLERGYKVRALEIDNELVGHLQDKFSYAIGKELEIVHSEAVSTLKNDDPSISPYIVSNLPYNISSYLMGYLLDSVNLKTGASGFQGAIIMFQKEFGERLTASEGGKDYGKISVMFNLKMDHEVLFKIPKEKFYPQPKVDGIVIKFSPKKDPVVIPDDDRFLRNLVNGAFMNRRKKLKNSILPGSLGTEISEEDILSVLDRNGLQNERPERVSPEQFVDIANQLLEAAR